MPKFAGNTSTSSLSTAYSDPVKIKSFSLVNKSGGAVLMNVSILYGSTNIAIIPINKSVASGEFYEDDKDILLLAGHQIYVLVNGSTDYYFTMENI